MYHLFFKKILLYCNLFKYKKKEVQLRVITAELHN